MATHAFDPQAFLLCRAHKGFLASPMRMETDHLGLLWGDIERRVAERERALGKVEVLAFASRTSMSKVNGREQKGR